MRMPKFGNMSADRLAHWVFEETDERTILQCSLDCNKECKACQEAEQAKKEVEKCPYKKQKTSITTPTATVTGPAEPAASPE